MKLRRFGIFFQQRVGKTRVAIDYMGVSYQLRGVRKVLIACPKIVRQVWVDQIKAYLPSEVLSIPRQVIVYDPKWPYLPGCEFEGDPLVIVVANYDMVWRHEAELAKWKPEIVIADEAHLLGAPTSKRSKSMWRLGQKALDRLALTGTPFSQKPTSAFGVARFIDESIFGRSFTKFEKKHVIINPYNHEVQGYRDLDEISDKLAPFSMRVLRSDVLKEPEVEHVTIPVDLEPKARKLYNDLAKDSLAELESGDVIEAPHVLTKMMRLQQITGGFAPLSAGTQKVSKAKLEALKELVEVHTEAGEQVVIVARFTAEIEEIGRTLGAPYIDGSTTDRVRQLCLKSFQGGWAKVLVIQEQTASMGIDLSAARVMIFYSQDFSLVNFLQVKDRIMGRGQQADSVTYYYLAVPGSVDEHVIDSLKRNQEITDYVSNRHKEVLKPL